MGPQLWQKIPGRVLLWALNLFSAIALIFEGLVTFYVEFIIKNSDTNCGSQVTTKE